jgi:dTDP-glucose 4,6-dehydratase
MDTVLVTGGAGFIGSHFVNRLAADRNTAVTVLDALTYAGNLDNLAASLDRSNVTFVHGDILDAGLVDALMRRHTAVVHFAAESHVDRSLLDAGTFLRTNVMGTHTLLDAALRHRVRRFVHISTDEVYGPLATGIATEDSPLRPSVPYASSKASSDLLALTYHQTYGLPVCVTRSSNNYGPGQYPEKIIPRFVTSLLQGHPVTLHGFGEHVRNWLHVQDNCEGVELVLRRGVTGQVYNLGGGTDLSNKELTGLLLRELGADWDAVLYVPDRRANDLRYAMDWGKAARDLGYRPRHDLAAGLAETVAWFRDRPSRWALDGLHGAPPGAAPAVLAAPAASS